MKQIIVYEDDLPDRHKKLVIDPFLGDFMFFIDFPVADTLGLYV